MTRSSSLAAVLLSCAVISGCTTPTPERVDVPVTVVAQAQPATPVIRSGRYTLVEIRPEQAQQVLLEQVVDITLPSGWDLTVGDAVRYVLRFSGYQLGEHCPKSSVLYELPLPAAHFRLGPMSLQDALKTLAGPTWRLQPDHTQRRICFTPATEQEPTP